MKKELLPFFGVAILLIAGRCLPSASTCPKGYPVVVTNASSTPVRVIIYPYFDDSRYVGAMDTKQFCAQGMISIVKIYDDAVYKKTGIKSKYLARISYRKSKPTVAVFIDKDLNITFMPDEKEAGAPQAG